MKAVLMGLLPIIPSWDDAYAMGCRYATDRRGEVKIDGIEQVENSLDLIMKTDGSA